MAEFFITTAISATFVVVVGVSLWPVILGLVLDGGCWPRSSRRWWCGGCPGGG